MIKLLDERDKSFSLIGDISTITNYLDIEDCHSISEIEKILHEEEASYFKLIPLKYEVVEVSDDNGYVHAYLNNLEEAKKEAEFWLNGCGGLESCIKSGTRVELRENKDPESDNPDCDLVEYYKGYKLTDEQGNIIAVLDYTYSNNRQELLEEAAESLTAELTDSFCKYCKDDDTIYMYSGDPEDFEDFSKTPIDTEVFLSELTYEDIEEIAKNYNGRQSSLPYFII